MANCIATACWTNSRKYRVLVSFSVHLPTIYLCLHPQCARMQNNYAIHYTSALAHYMLNLSYLMNMIFYVTVIFQFYTKLKGAVAIFTLIHDRQFIALYITELYSARLYSNIVIVTNGLLSCTIIVP